MKLVTLVILLFGLIAPPVFADGGGDVGNGGGIAEQNFAFAYDNLETYMRMCLASAQCQLTKSEQDALNEILADMPVEKQRGGNHPLVFLSGKTHPGFFDIDGAVRIAKTGDQIGSSIYVNLDLIYTSRASGADSATDVPTAVQVLVHELGHHHGIKDHQFLDLLGAKVRTVVLGETQHVAYHGSAPGIALTVINEESSEGPAQILLQDSAKIYDLSPSLSSRFDCHGGKLLGYLLWNVHWGNRHSDGPGSPFFTLPIRASVDYSCRMDDNNIVQTSSLSVYGSVAFGVVQEGDLVVSHYAEWNSFRLVNDSVVKLDLSTDFNGNQGSLHIVLSDGSWDTITMDGISMDISPQILDDGSVLILIRLYNDNHQLIASPSVVTTWNKSAKITMIHSANEAYSIEVTPQTASQ